MPTTSDLSIVHGPTSPPLWSTTLTKVIDEQAQQYGDKAAVVVPWQSARLSYRDLAGRSKLIAKALLGSHLGWGDCVGIMAGNRHEYIDVFLGGARIGCPIVVLNSTCSPAQLESAVTRSRCRIIFIATSIGTTSLAAHIDVLNTLPSLRRVVYLGSTSEAVRPAGRIQSYNDFLSAAHSVFLNDSFLRRVETAVKESDLLNIQFTSGSTGLPKAAMLTHRNLINNGRLVGQAMKLTSDDVICCPPPLFHCFGLVMGFLASFCHGSTIVFPSDRFNADEAIDAVIKERATALLGVPTMFLAELDVLERTKRRIQTLRTGLIAGSSVPEPVMNRVAKTMNFTGLLIAYGMTETSPVTFITALDDPPKKRATTLGKVMPHTAAKVVDQEGKIVRIGQRGELCTSGYALQKGYWNDEAATRQAMRRDADGTIWMHTGDEGYLDKEGYGHITGRIKDLIIRGGENISPAEIDERLMAHPSISEACVVGLEDQQYGEVVGCFLRRTVGAGKLPDETVRQWVTDTLGRMRAPKYVFWIGDSNVGSSLPKTGSGKIQKYLVRELGNKLLKEMGIKSKL